MAQLGSICGQILRLSRSLRLGRPAGGAALALPIALPIALLAALILVSWPAPASAKDNYFTETHYDLGIQSVSSLAFGGGSASGTAVHLTEHNGLISRVPHVLMMLFAVFQAGGDVKMVGGYSTSQQESEMQWVTGNGKVVDSKPIVSTSRSLNVSFVPLTEEEKARRDAGLARTGAQLTMLAMLPSHFDFVYLPNRDDAHLRGFRAVIYPLALGIGKHFEIALGYAGARLQADLNGPRATNRQTITHESRGMAARIGFAPARWLVLVGELHSDVAGESAGDSFASGASARASAALSIPRLERFFCKVAAERLQLAGDSPLSTSLEFGVRF